MRIKKIISGPLGNNCYIVYDEKAKEAAIIDVPEDSSSLIELFLQQEKLKALYIINTHGHFDHIYENAKAVEMTNAKICCHENDAKMLYEPEPKNVFGKFKLKPSKADILLKEGDELKIGNFLLKVLHTPGHTPGSICLYNEKEKTLFTGDTLFKGTYGRTDLWGGNDKEMKKTLKRLAELPKDTKVFPGHDEGTTIGEELGWMRQF